MAVIRRAFSAVAEWIFAKLCAPLWPLPSADRFVVKKREICTQNLRGLLSFSKSQGQEKRPQRLVMSIFSFLTSDFWFSRLRGKNKTSKVNCTHNYSSPYSRIWRLFPEGDCGREVKSCGTSIPWVAPMAVTGRAFSAVAEWIFAKLCAPLWPLPSANRFVVKKREIYT